MVKLTKFDLFSDALFSFNKFKYKNNSTNSEKYNKILKILSRVIENELTEKQKMCVKLYYHESMNTVKIANKLGVYPSTVWRHINNSKKKIKNIMKYYYSI